MLENKIASVNKEFKIRKALNTLLSDEVLIAAR